LNEHLPDSII